MITSALIALVVSSCQIGNSNVPCNRSTGAPWLSNFVYPMASGGGSPLFEFAPASGAGTGGSACIQCVNFSGAPENMANTTVWFADGSGVAAPTRTAAFGTDPNGHPLNASRVEFPATTVGQYSRIVLNPNLGTGATQSGGWKVKGNGTSGTLDICSHVGPTWTCSDCVYNATTWVDCKRENIASCDQFLLGNATVLNGGVGRPINDVLVWGAQFNDGATLNTYVPLPYGAKGEVMTFTRNSTAYCTKANELTSIANGDLVLCQAGVQRIMPGGAGTGALGLNVWEARTNSALRSTEIDNAVWVPVGTGVAAPTVTANAAVAPDGTTTAERVQVVATTGVQRSCLLQSNACPASNPWSAGIYIKGNGTARSDFPFCTTNDTIDAVCVTVQCSYNASTWTRCTNQNVASAVGRDMIIGNAGPEMAGASGVAHDVFLWQAGCEAGAVVSPPITTAGTAATRVIEAATFTTSPPVGSGAANGSAAATFVLASVPATLSGGGITFNGSAGRPLYLGSNNANFYDGTTVVAIAASLSANVAKRYASSWIGSVETVYNITDGTSASATFDGALVVTNQMELGTSPGGVGPLNGTIKLACYDTNPTRCR